MREEIARWYFGNSSWDGVDPRLTAWCYKRADELMALIKEAGYVKLAEDQSLRSLRGTVKAEYLIAYREGSYLEGWEHAQQEMLKAGLRKVKQEGK